VCVCVCVYYKEESVRKANIREKKLQKSSNCDALVLSSITVVFARYDDETETVGLLPLRVVEVND